MSVFKCKMCGGDLEVTEGMKVVECEYCGTTQTVPNSDNEKKTNLFNRANRLRIANEFDRAAGVYENIISEFPREAEAYWGLCLCKFGIEYVDDPRTAEKIPTCHRTAFESIFDDSNFKTAIELSDPVAKKVYNSEARIIDTLQQNILTIVNREKPFDVFICYKETDSKGDRTMDSVLAQDIYDALTAKGLKVFFARITLEDKLGQEYEPYIFAALNSAKIMLAIGTAEEYYNAVWVKNEWSRFLSLMKTDRSKVLIPCYKDIDAYDMPAEFRNLQAQDMGKLGFVQDLTRGVCKILGVEEKKETVVEKVIVKEVIKERVVGASTQNIPNINVSGILDLAFEDLKNGKYFEASKSAGKAIGFDPANVRAHLCKLCAEMRVNDIEKLSESEKGNIEDSDYYKNILCIADDDLKEKLKKQAKIQKARFEERKRKEEERIAGEKRKEQEEIHIFNEKWEIEKVSKFETADNLLRNAKRLSDYDKIKELFVGYEEMDEVKNLLEEVSAQKRECYRKIVKHVESQLSFGNPHIVFLNKGHAYVSGKSTTAACVKKSELWNLDSICFVLDHYDNNQQWPEFGFIGFKKTGEITQTKDSDNVNSEYKKSPDYDFSDCTEIKKVLVFEEKDYITLKIDGTVVKKGDYSEKISQWKDIIDISTSGKHIVGLKSDGTVVAVGENGSKQCNVSEWKDIVAIETSEENTLGVKRNGTVVQTGNKYDISDWRDIVIAASERDGDITALQSNGELVHKNRNQSRYNFKKGKIAGVFANNFNTVVIYFDGSAEIKGIDNNKQCNCWACKIFDDAEEFAEQREKMLKERYEKKMREKAEQEAARKAKIESLEKEKATLEAELSNIKGLFSGGKKAKVEARIAEIEKELQTLK
ncbi:MAG: TIR domain-containing protein [Oscillospiraceae bacterium]|nr:TIR domain-containing protein [Oscillospiraceae bacterium]